MTIIPVDNEKPAACARKSYQVSWDDLPLSCPMPSMRIWDAHPRVFLPIAETGEIECPYCGAHYLLNETK